MNRKLIAAAVIVAAGIAPAGSAFAGEVSGSANGNGPKGPEHANSICVFSGLEDGSEDPTAPSGPGTAQNWGQIPAEFRAFLTSIGENPGIACNGHLNPWQEVIEG
jgi:hypothetical protein